MDYYQYQEFQISWQSCLVMQRALIYLMQMVAASWVAGKRLPLSVSFERATHQLLKDL